MIMDITLERILTLIPKKEDGKFKHGALSSFARKLGFKDGHIISDWIAGNSTSYLNYLYQISALYNVSVEWLKGETDIKNPAPISGGGNFLFTLLKTFELYDTMITMKNMIRRYYG